MNCSVRVQLTVLVMAVFMGTVWQPARAELFVSGSSFTVEGTNSPDIFSSPATLSSGVQSLDSGKLLLTVSDVPAADGAEWLIFSYQTASSGPLSQPPQDWALGELGLQATEPVKAIAGFAQFDDNGTLLNPYSRDLPRYHGRSEPYSRDERDWSAHHSDLFVPGWAAAINPDLY